MTSKTLRFVVVAASFTFMLGAVAAEVQFLAWLAWGLLFLGLEVIALRDRAKGDTLSEQVWLGTLSKNRAWSLFWKAAVSTLLVWLVYHFLTGP